MDFGGLNWTTFRFLKLNGEKIKYKELTFWFKLNAQMER